MNGRWRHARRGTRFVLGSLMLHAALLILTASTWRETRRSAPSTAPALEVDIEPPPDLTQSQQQQPQTAAAGLRAASGTRATQRVQGTLPRAVGELSSDSVSAGESPSESEAAAQSNAPARKLDLMQLGVAGPNPFFDRRASPPPSKQARTKRRLDRALAQGLTNQDTALGLGAGSPMIRALEAAVYASTVPLNASALFTLVVDSNGSLVSSSVGDVSEGRKAWEGVARQAALALAQRTMRVPKGKSVKVTIRVTSHLELPSGRDPGLEIRAAGIPIKPGSGKRSTRLDILNPLNPLGPLALDGDPADIGARPRRMVRAHVLSEELL